MRYLANVVTSLRLVCALFLFFLKPFSLPFWILYSICGVSDVLDGCIARALKQESEWGAKLDSIADAAFVFACAVTLLPVLSIPAWLWIGTMLIVAVRLLSYLLGLLKFHTFPSLHTYANKLSGLLLFCAPVMCVSVGVGITGVVLLIICLLASLEEFLILAKAKVLDRNCKSILKS